MSSERPLIVSEGNWLDDADRMLMSKQVDFREPRDRYSVSTLVKLGESQLAPRRLRTIRISKPEFFRRGRDPNETRAQQSTEHVDDIDEPEGLAQLRAAEVNRAAELVDSRIRVTADGMRVRQTRRRKTTNTISLRNHGWIYCTGVDAQVREEQRDELAPHGRAAVGMDRELLAGRCPVSGRSPQAGVPPGAHSRGG